MSQSGVPFRPATLLSESRWARSTTQTTVEPPRAPERDTLDDIGLPSKGDKRLLDHALQASYFGRIQRRYAAFSKRCDAIGADHSSLIGSKHDYATESGRAMLHVSNELGTLLQSMRKLREGLLGSRRHDDFAAQVYLFIIEAAIPFGAHEAYAPAMAHMIFVLQPQGLLMEAVFGKVKRWYMLDLACRKGNLVDAIGMNGAGLKKDVIVARVLRDLARNNWIAFLREYGQANKIEKALMATALPALRMKAIDCVNKSYLTLSVVDISALFGCDWRELKEKHTPAWSLSDDGSKVMVKRLRER